MDPNAVNVFAIQYQPLLSDINANWYRFYWDKLMRYLQFRVQGFSITCRIDDSRVILTSKDGSTDHLTGISDRGFKTHVYAIGNQNWRSFSDLTVEQEVAEFITGGKIVPMGKGKVVQRFRVPRNWYRGGGVGIGQMFGSRSGPPAACDLKSLCLMTGASMPENEAMISSYWAFVGNKIPSTTGIVDVAESYHVHLTITTNLYVQCFRKVYGGDI